MIKANELRIGNLIEWNKTVLIITCVNIDYIIAYDSIKDELIHDNASQSMFNPISLTTEWLERFGFKDELPWSKDSFRYDDEKRLHMCTRHGCIIIAYDVEFVHQMQNIIHALTNQELTTTK